MGNVRKRWVVHRPPRVKQAHIVALKLICLRLLILAVFSVLAAQLWRMQVVEGKQYQQRAELNRLRLLPIAPTRGIVYDRNGVILARNVPSFTVSIMPADVPRSQQEDVSGRLSELLDIPADEISDLVNKRRSQLELFTPVPIKERVDQETAFILEERSAEFPGVQVSVEPTRQYEGMFTSQIIGYTGRISAEEYSTLKSSGYELNDRLGKTGVESSYEDQLRGKPGKEQVEVNAAGKRIRTLERSEPRTGNNIVLSIDLDLQEKITEFLLAGKGRSQHAVAIAMNPQTGEILSMVSLPTYDNNVFTSSISREMLAELLQDPRRPLFNHAISAQYPPGSIFKIVTASGALQDRVANPRTQIVSTGEITVPNKYDPSIVYTFRDWAALGMLDFYQAIARSSDIYFYYLAGGYKEFRGLGVERLSHYARAFGLGQPTGIDLPGEANGLVPDERWKQERLREPWVTGDTYNYGIGQGYVLTTPLQMVNVAAAVASNGTLMRPRVVREISDADGNVIAPFSPEPVGKLPVSSANLDIIREGMRQAAEWGTATGAKIPGIRIAGKTGTAEYGMPDPITGKYAAHGWFLTFAPYENPEIALVVFLEEGNGAADAAPLAGKILRYYFERTGRISRDAPPVATPVIPIASNLRPGERVAD
ncbi:MAG: penicillin-binding protein 2 [Chloroflexi bacterium]|nr:penicillin-binding protein 2 [Chloroflexota bacterium]